MTHTILILLAVSLDVFSFGLSLGFNNVYLSIIKGLFFTLISAFIFAFPLALSKLISQIIPEKICYLINGIVLLLLGLYYLISFIVKIKIKNSKNAQKGTNKTNLKNEHENINPLAKTPFLGLKYLAFCAIPVNLDAFFTALLSGFSMGNFFIVLLFYLIFTFIAVYIGNKLSFYLSKKANLDLSWISGILFIILGMLKLFE